MTGNTENGVGKGSQASASVGQGLAKLNVDTNSDKVASFLPDAAAAAAAAAAGAAKGKAQASAGRRGAACGWLRWTEVQQMHSDVVGCSPVQQNRAASARRRTDLVVFLPLLLAPLLDAAQDAGRAQVAGSEPAGRGAQRRAAWLRCLSCWVLPPLCLQCRCLALLPAWLPALAAGRKAAPSSILPVFLNALP